MIYFLAIAGCVLAFRFIIPWYLIDYRKSSKIDVTRQNKPGRNNAYKPRRHA